MIIFWRHSHFVSVRKALCRPGIWLALCSLWWGGANLRAKGIFQTSFEEYPAESLVTFLDSGWGNYSGLFPMVAIEGSRFLNVPIPTPFEGSKALLAPGGVVFRSPDGRPMQQISFKGYVFGEFASAPVFIDIPKENFQKWTDVVLNFPEPLMEYRFLASYVDGIENFAIPFFVDNLQIVTVPEPRSVALVGLGIAGFAVARRRRSQKD